MTRLERYVATRLLRPIVAVFTVTVVIVLAFYISRYLGDAVVERLDLATVGRLAALRLALFFDVLLPASLFLGVVIGLARLQIDGEIVALAALGCGRTVVLRAVLAIALSGMLVVVLLSHVFRPWGYAQLYRIEAETAVRVDLGRVEPGRFEVGDREWVFFAARRDGDALLDVVVHQRLENQRNLLRARRLTQHDLDDGRIGLRFDGDVRFYHVDLDGDADLVSRSESLMVLMDPPPPTERERLRRALAYSDLLRRGGALEWAELQWRSMMPLSVVLLLLTALLIARIQPRQGQTGRLLEASLLVALYFSVVGTLTDRIDSGAIPVWPGLFWVPIILVPVVAVMYWRRWSGPGSPL
ncbi:MAG: LPS export ABC transporter permease LptF [Wenzhouxiangellaceae bacterium]